MLTEIQKERLTQLIDKCEDIPLKNLIKAASKHWINGTIVPIKNDYGIKIENQIYGSACYKSCLIASAMINEKCSCHPDSYDRDYIGYLLKIDASKKFNIPFSRISQIIRRFDNSIIDIDNEPILKELKEILFS